MTYSEIIITFNADLAIGEELFFRHGPQGGAITNVIKEEWVFSRSQSYQVSTGFDSGVEPGVESATFFVQSFNLDYNSSNLYEVTRNLNVVTIKSFSADRLFYSPTSPSPNDPFGPYPAVPNDVDLTINNQVNDIFSLTSVEFLPATTNPACTHYIARFTTSELATKIDRPESILNNTQNPISFELTRGRSFTFVAESEDGQGLLRRYGQLLVPATLNASKFDVTVNPSANGATVIITPIESLGGLIVTYSLDNVTWQADNQFTGLAEGNYTLYVRDQLGCSFNIPFTVTETGIVRIPYFFMPKSNSIRYANRVTWGDCSNYKTDENTLSCESRVDLPYKEIQKFQSCDIVTTQFFTNYETRTATIVKSDGTEVDVPVNKVSNYIGLKDRRDARKYNLGNGTTGIYFTSGNLYDYDTGDDIGDYALNGLLPEWAKVGSFLIIDNASYLIEEIFIDEDVNAQVIIINNSYIGSDALIQVSAIYDLENYDEYEYDIDFVDYIDERLQVRLDIIDSEFTDIQQLSEVIDVKIRHLGTLDIKYKNSENTDMNYSRGLQHTLRMLIEKINGRLFDESETYVTDTAAVLLGAEIREMDEFVFSPVTKELMRKLVLALSHDTITIDGVSYVKNDAIVIEGPLEDTNLYDVTATMIKSGSGFNSNAGQGSLTFNGESIEIPGLIEHDSGYVGY